MPRIIPIGQVTIDTHPGIPMARYLDPWEIEYSPQPVDLILSISSPVQPAEPIADTTALVAWMYDAGLVVMTDHSKPRGKLDRHTLIIGRKT